MEAARNEPRVSVVMPTYDRAHALERVVAPLLEDECTHELIVVVDGSRDGSLELLARIASRDARLKPLFMENRGEMAARQAGAETATGEVVLFIDDDVLAEPGLVRGHRRRHAGREHLVVLGYMPIELPRRRSARDFATFIYSAEYEGRCVVYEQDPVSVLRELWGGNFSMRRSDCLEIGMQNPAYAERYHPDREFGLRCLEAGLIGVFDRSLRATHLHRRSLPAFARDARSQGAARVMLHRLHPVLIDPPACDEFERGLPRPARALVRSAQSPRAERVIAAALRSQVWACGAARAWALQEAAARLLRRIEQQRGALETRRRESER